MAGYLFYNLAAMFEGQGKDEGAIHSNNMMARAKPDTST
jgi:hypothetical protein